MFKQSSNGFYRFLNNIRIILKAIALFFLFGSIIGFPMHCFYVLVHGIWETWGAYLLGLSFFILVIHVTSRTTDFSRIIKILMTAGIAILWLGTLTHVVLPQYMKPEYETSDIILSIIYNIFLTGLVIFLWKKVIMAGWRFPC